MNFVERSPFAQALLDVSLEGFADISAEELSDQRFSPAFEKKLGDLIKSTRHNAYRPVGRTIRRVSLVAVSIAALVVMVMAIPAIRNVLIPYEHQNTGTDYEHILETDPTIITPGRIEKVYKPFYIPEGFKENNVVITEYFACYAWVTEEDDCIFFDQYVISDYQNDSGPSSENVETKILLLNGYEVFCVYHAEGGVSYRWTDDEYFYMLHCDNCITEEERNAIFYSIAVDEEARQV